MQFFAIVLLLLGSSIAGLSFATASADAERAQTTASIEATPKKPERPEPKAQPAPTIRVILVPYEPRTN